MSVIDFGLNFADVAAKCVNVSSSLLRTYADTLDIVVEELKLPKEEDKQLW